MNPWYHRVMRGSGELVSLIGIFVLIFVLWVSTGGPSRPVSFSGPYLRPITTTGTTAQPYGDPSKFSSINTNITVGVGGVDSTAGTSPLGGAVTFSSDYYGATQTDPEKEYLVVTLSVGSAHAVSTAGWKIVSRESGNGALFPQGVEIARSGRVHTPTPLILNPGDKVIVTTGRSPVGVSFRENTCTGYLEEHQDFHPPLSQKCPTPSEEFSRYYREGDSNGTCATYINSIPYCATKTSLYGTISSSCENFVEDHLNYNSCVDAHKNDADFKTNTWRVFLEKRSELWRASRETITLLDANNKVIDSIMY